jgi:hypothetical protein
MSRSEERRTKPKEGFCSGCAPGEWADDFPTTEELVAAMSEPYRRALPERFRGMDGYDLDHALTEERRRAR